MKPKTKAYPHKAVLDKINNTGYNIKINHRTVNGKTILFLNYRKDGINRTKRLVMLTGDKTNDLILVNNAMIKRNEFEKVANQNKPDRVFKPSTQNLRIADYIDQLPNNKTWQRITYLKKHLANFAGESLTLQQIDKQFCIKFTDYIQTIGKSAKFYLAAFKHILTRAADEEIIHDIPYLRKLTIKYKPTSSDYLTWEEILKINATPYKHAEYKNAFLFACNTGLRYVDLHQLTFNDIHDGILSITQQKTKEPLRIKLSQSALKIVETQKAKNTTKIFEIASFDMWRRNVKSLCKAAGITKRITGHSARHTFATLCVTLGHDIYVISKLLGHTSVKETQRYSKVEVEKKDAVIDTLPELPNL